ncbi:MAG: glycosyltransferase involved in cell wall biosynthesis [Halioglobus sp.]
MKKLLFITSELPFPAQSGGKVKSLKLLQALAQRYDVTLACPLKCEDASHVEAFHAISPCKGHLHRELDIPRTLVNLFKSYLKRIPLNVYRSHSRQLNTELAKIVSGYDIVLLDHYEVCSYLPPDYRGLTVYHAHNAYFKIWQRYAQLPGNLLMRFASWLEARRVSRSEARLAVRCDLTFAAPNDASELVALGVDKNKLRPTYHLGDDQQLQLADLCYADTREKIMYVGFLGWEPNVQGLLWFIDEVWPQLVAQRPGLLFDIVGKNPDERLCEAVGRYSGIKLCGFVADLQEIYQDSRVSVAPLLFGSGMKVKVLDAMARGMPTVTTTVGAEGIQVVSGTHLMISDAAITQASQINRLLCEPLLWQSLQCNSRALIRQRYTWLQLFTGMHRDLEAALLCNVRQRRCGVGGKLIHVG